MKGAAASTSRVFFLRRKLRWLSCLPYILGLVTPQNGLSQSPPPSTRIPLEATPKPAALPAGKAAVVGVRTPEPSDETLSRLLRMRSRLKNLEVDTQWIEGEEITRRFRATMGKGRLSGEGQINWSRPGERQWARVDVIDADVEEFLHVCDVRFDGKIIAQVTGQLNLEWHGMRFREMRATMTGGGKLEMSSGSVSSTRLLDNIARLSGIESLRTLRFQRGVVEGTISDGRVTVRRFELQSQDIVLHGSGTVTLETGALDARFELEVRPVLAKSSKLPEVRAAGEAIARFVGSEDRFVSIPLPVSFGGTLERPIAYLDIPGRKALQQGLGILNTLTTPPARRHSPRP
ncbi:MAG: AsmA-like C-terminal region-containing protein [Candidatus Sumerlaeaceae bacterium]|nr:AsmA-like C-terminal region-containing protein [Candidatus Sumerlaeaceae bacterium]